MLFLDRGAHLSVMVPIFFGSPVVANDAGGRRRPRIDHAVHTPPTHSRKSFIYGSRLMVVFGMKTFSASFLGSGRNSSMPWSDDSRRVV